MKACHRLSVFRLLTVILLILSVALAVPAQKKKQSFWQRLLRFAGISATPSAQKGPDDEAATGDIWLLEVNSSKAFKLTTAGGYRSPIFLFGDKKILALKGVDVVEIGLPGGQPKTLFSMNGAVKLVGLNMDDPNAILVLIEDQNRDPGLGLLSLSNGRVTKIPPGGTEEFRRAVTHARGWERVYGSTKVYVKTEIKTDLAGAREWSDVYLKQANGAPRNLSLCDGTDCGQPSLSQNGRSVVFIKAPRVY